MSVMVMDCPEYLDDSGAVRCGLPAEVQRRYTSESTSGPVEGVRIRCPRGHSLNGPVEFLTCADGGRPAPATSRPRSPESLPELGLR